MNCALGRIRNALSLNPRRACLAMLLLGCLPNAKPSTIISVGGVFQGYTGVGGLSEGWSIASPVQNVTVSALLASGGGNPSTGTAFLTTSIGPGTTVAQEIAQTNISVCAGCQQDVVLFSGLDLAAGTYWLTLGQPAPPASFLSWTASNPASITTGPGTSYLGYEALQPFYGPFPPSGTFLYPSPVANAFAYDFAVISVPLSPPAGTPEPAGVWICGLGLAVVFASKWGRSKAGAFPE